MKPAIDLIYDVPIWAVGPVCVFGFVLPSLLGLWLVHRSIQERMKVSETLTVVTSYCFQVQQFCLHLLLTTGLASRIGLLVNLIAALDRPYRGAVSIEPTAYRIVLDDMIDN